MVDIKEQVRRHIGNALAALGDSSPADEQLHEARKQLKRSRAGLRLMRDTVGESAYSTENAELRDAARPLGQLRDATVMLQVLQHLPGARDRSGARRSADSDSAPAAAALQGQLKAERTRLRDKLQRGALLQDIRQSLEQVLERIVDWPVPAKENLRQDLRRIYRRGRKVLEGIESRPTTDNLHELRKQLKYLGQAIRILNSSNTLPQTSRDGGKSPARLDVIAMRAEWIADRLGDDHDLAVLAGRIAALTGGPDASADEKSAGELDSHIAQRRKNLQRKALKHGRRMYERKPRDFARRVFASIGSDAAKTRERQYTRATKNSIAPRN